MVGFEESFSPDRRWKAFFKTYQMWSVWDRTWSVLKKDLDSIGAEKYSWRPSKTCHFRWHMVGFEKIFWPDWCCKAFFKKSVLSKKMGCSQRFARAQWRVLSGSKRPATFTGFEQNLIKQLSEFHGIAKCFIKFLRIQISNFDGSGVLGFQKKDSGELISAKSLILRSGG